MKPLHNTTILMPCFSTPSVDKIIGYAIPLTRVFNASITFLWMNENTESSNSFQENLYNKLNKLKQSSEIRFLNYSFPFNTKSVIEKNQNNEEVITILFNDLPSGNLKHFKEIRFILKANKLRLPYMVLPETTRHKWSPETVFIPAGYNRTDKETAIWASYYARFNNSRLIILKAKETETWANNNILSNIRFMHKIFHDLGLKYEIQESDSSSGHLANTAIDLAKDYGNSLLILSTTRHYGIEHYLAGPKELQIIKNKSHIPVLCINPVKNAYILCR